MRNTVGELTKTTETKTLSMFGSIGSDARSGRPCADGQRRDRPKPPITSDRRDDTGCAAAGLREARVEEHDEEDHREEEQHRRHVLRDAGLARFPA